MIIMKTPGSVLLAILIADLATTTASAQSTLPKAQHDSLWAVWSDPMQADTARLGAILDFIWDGYLFSQPDSAWYFAQLKYEFASANEMQKGMGAALNIQAIIFLNRGDYPKALDHLRKSLKMFETIGDKNDISASLNNLGIIYHNMGDYIRALEYYQQCLKIQEEMGYQQSIASLLNNIGVIHMELGNLPKALDNFQRNLTTSEETPQVMNNIGMIYGRQADYAKALDHYNRSLKLAEDIGDNHMMGKTLLNIGSSHQKMREYNAALSHFHKGLKLFLSIGDKKMIAKAYNYLGTNNHLQSNFKEALAWCDRGQRLAEELGAVDEQKEACQCLYEAYKAMGRGNEALVYLEKIGELDKQLNKEETAKKLQQMEFQQVMLQDSIAKAEEARLVQEAHQEEVRRTTRTRNVFAVSGSFLLLIAGGFYSRSRYMRRSRDIISKERDRSENLLLNILPAEIAEELKSKGRCEARDFDLVSILFTDFKGFTEQSASMSAAALVNEINHCFEAFDGIMAKYGIEKIKTIGDAYMAAGGVPVPTEDSVKNTVLAALEMQKFIRERKVQKDTLGEPAFEMRVGIHTGPVVAGIVGVKKFQYDIWGDTVNTASRMESSGVVGQVNISESTYRLLQDDPQFEFTPRGKVEAKGKGELEMFLVQENEAGTVNMEERRLESTPD
jgi:adenylate cyclase